MFSLDSKVAFVTGGNGGIQGVFLDHSVRHVPIKKLWRLKWHREFDTSVKMNWPRWMAGYPEYR